MPCFQVEDRCWRAGSDRQRFAQLSGSPLASIAFSRSCAGKSPVLYDVSNAASVGRPSEGDSGQVSENRLLESIRPQKRDTPLVSFRKFEHVIVPVTLHRTEATFLGASTHSVRRRETTSAVRAHVPVPAITQIRFFRFVHNWLRIRPSEKVCELLTPGFPLLAAPVGTVIHQATFCVGRMCL